MQYVFIIFPVILLLHSCGSHHEETSALNKFFVNSLRRDANESEKGLVVRTPKGCAAFFIKNNQNKTILGSARHCFDHKITEWCNTGGPLVDNFGNQGKCERIIAADTTHDFAIFSAKFPYIPSADQTLTLTTFEPKIGTNLKMIGYPADKYRAARLTVTENCWILKSSVTSPHLNMRDRSSLHNCTTYGGNSGGPMIVSGTSFVVGLPFTYAPNDYNLRDSQNLTTAAYMAKTSDLTLLFRSKLLAEGIVIAN